MPSFLDALLGITLEDLADALAEVVVWAKDTPIVGELLDAMEFVMDWVMEQLGVQEIIRSWIRKIPRFPRMFPTISIDFFSFDFVEFPDPLVDLNSVISLPQNLAAKFLGSLPGWLSECVQVDLPVGLDFECIASKVPVLNNVIDEQALLSTLAESAQSKVLEIASGLLPGVKCAQETEIVIPIRATLKESANFDIGSDTCDVVQRVCTDFEIDLNGFALNNMLKALWKELEPFVNQLNPEGSEQRKLSDSDDASPMIIPLLNLEWDIALPDFLKFSKEINLPAKNEDHALVSPSQLVVASGPMLGKIILDYDLSQFKFPNFYEGIGLALEIRPANISVKRVGGELIQKTGPRSTPDAARMNRQKVETMMSALLKMADPLGWNLHFKKGNDTGRIVLKYEKTPNPNPSVKLDGMRGLHKVGQHCYHISREEDYTIDLDYSVTRPPRKFKPSHADIRNRDCSAMVVKDSDRWESLAQICWCSIYLAEDILFHADPMPTLFREWKQLKGKQFGEYGRIEDWKCTRKNMQRVLEDNRKSQTDEKTYEHSLLASLCYNYWVVDDSVEERTGGKWVSPHRIGESFNEMAAAAKLVDILKPQSTKRLELVKHHLNNYVAFYQNAAHYPSVNSNTLEFNTELTNVLMRGSELGWSYPEQSQGKGKSLWSLSNCFQMVKDCEKATTDIVKNACHLSRLNYNMKSMDDVLGYYTHGTGRGTQYKEGKDGHTYYVKSTPGSRQEPVPVAENFEQFPDTPRPEQTCPQEIVEARNLLFSSPPSVPIECEPKTLHEIFEYEQLTRTPIYSDLNLANSQLSPDNSYSPYGYLLGVVDKVTTSNCLAMWNERFDRVDEILSAIREKSIKSILGWGYSIGWQYPLPFRNSGAARSIWWVGIGCYDVPFQRIGGPRSNEPTISERKFSENFMKGSLFTYPDRISDDHWNKCATGAIAGCRFARARESDFVLNTFRDSCRENVYEAQDLLFPQNSKYTTGCSPAENLREYRSLNRDPSLPAILPDQWTREECSKLWTSNDRVDVIRSKLRNHIQVVTRMCTGGEDVIVGDSLVFEDDACFEVTHPDMLPEATARTFREVGALSSGLTVGSLVDTALGALISAGGSLRPPDAVKFHTLPLFGLAYRQLGFPGCPSANQVFQGGYVNSLAFSGGPTLKGLALTVELVNQALVIGEPSDISSFIRCWTSVHLNELQLWESEKRKLAAPPKPPLLKMNFFKTRLQILGGSWTPESSNPSTTTTSTSVATTSTTSTTTTSKSWDYLQIDNWRLAHVCESCPISHFSISSDNKKTSQIFRETGTTHRGPRNDFNGWDMDGGTGTTFSDNDIVFGNKGLQIRDWRIKQMDDTRLSVSHESGNVARIYRSDGTISGNVKRFSGYKEELGEPTCTYLTNTYLQVGEWRFGAYDAIHLSVSHRGGKTAMIYRSDGNIFSGPRADYNSWDITDGQVIMGSSDGCNF